MTTAIGFCFDFLSPYAYLAWTQVHGLAARHGRTVAPRPVVLAALLTANATKGPAEIPAKRDWVFRDTVRRARYLGVPFGPPPAHPFNPLLALRVVLAAPPGPDRVRVVDALFRATWGGGPGVEDPDVLRDVVAATGLPADALLAAATSDVIKAALRQETEAAIGRGVFGVPTVEVDGEAFWGLDAFDHVARRLEGRDVLTADDLARWRDLPATAQRR